MIQSLEEGKTYLVILPDPRGEFRKQSKQLEKFLTGVAKVKVYTVWLPFVNQVQFFELCGKKKS